MSACSGGGGSVMCGHGVLCVMLAHWRLISSLAVGLKAVLLFVLVVHL